jgi:hypothetical protein
MQKHMKISQKQTSLFTEEQLTYLQGDSHANHIAQQESDLGKKTAATSGRKCLEQFKKLNRDGLLAKTLPGFLLGMTDWSSEKCVLTWKMKGTKSKHLLFQLVPLVRRTEGIGFGLLPTPQAMDMMQNPPREITKSGRIISNQGQNGSAPLKDLAMNGLLPTPIAGDWKGQLRGDGTASMLLGKASLGLLPTPQLSDFKGSGSLESLQKRGRGQKNDLSSFVTYNTNGKNSQLNPQFVAEMMGFPINWTELPFLNGETNPSKDTETL